MLAATAGLLKQDKNTQNQDTTSILRSESTTLLILNLQLGLKELGYLRLTCLICIQMQMEAL